MKFNELYVSSKRYFFKNEQVQKGETVLQIIQEQLKVRKLILINYMIFKPVRKNTVYSTCFEVGLKCVATVLISHSLAILFLFYLIYQNLSLILGA